MMIPVPPPGTSADDDTAGSEQPTSEERNSPPRATVSAINYVEFAAAVKDACATSTVPICSPAIRCSATDVCNFGRSAGPQELRALLCETVGTLFGNPRDEKLRRMLELTYCQPGLKQEAVADRLALSFGTYRRHLGTARDRMARWLWESSQVAQVQPELQSTAGPTTREAGAEAEGATLPEIAGPASPRLSVVVLPFSTSAAMRGTILLSTALPRRSRLISRAAPASS